MQSNTSTSTSSTKEYIKLLALGAGQQVGRSCVLVQIKDKKIVFDTGIHMLYSDQRRYPDFGSLYQSPHTINNAIDLVLITHFHLDHCGALPYLTQVHKYNGPIYASTPTKAMIPYMLEDFRKVTSDVKKEESQFYTYSVQEVKNVSSKVKSIALQQTITINGIKITSFYAGHVLGASMFFVEYGGLSVLYTGDYNSYADRHLGAAYAPRLCPNIVITQTTYATTIRDTKRDRERKMLKIVTQTLQNGGKVLIPVFALGRAQQLSVLLQTYWNRTGNKCPIYFSAGLIQKANFYYQLFVNWQNQKIKEQFENGQSVFQFKKVKPFDKSLIRSETPYVLFATPGMLHGGTSMQVFKQWCGDQKNTIIIPGYCVQGTIGNKLLKGIKTLDIDKKRYEVNMRIQNISFSAHADAKGIISLLRHLNSQNIVFVHGDKVKMHTFAEIVEQQLQKKVYMPENMKMINIPVTEKIQIKAQKNSVCYPEGYLIKSSQKESFYKFIRQNQLLRQVNEMNKMMNEKENPGIIVDSQITCQLCMSQQQMLRYRFDPSEDIILDIDQSFKMQLQQSQDHQQKQKLQKNNLQQQKIQKQKQKGKKTSKQPTQTQTHHVNKNKKSENNKSIIMKGNIESLVFKLQQQ